jgi:hypothetical protein
METQEKLEACEQKKHDGNLLFKAQNFRRASKKYEKVCFRDPRNHAQMDLNAI